MQGWWFRKLARALVVCALARGAAAAPAEGEAARSEGQPTTARAERAAAPEETADALIARGIDLRKAGDDRSALAAFERAFQLGGSARARAQMALAEQALGLWREAYEHLEPALQQADDAWIAEHRATLDTALGEIAAQLGQLEVSCNVDAAEIRLDGQVLGKTPLTAPLRLAAGASVVQLSAPGYFAVARQVYIDAGQLSRVNVVLTPSGVTAESAGSVPASRVPPAPAPDRPSPARDALLYGSVGLAALGLTVGVTGYVLREVNVDTYNNDAICNQEQGTPRSQECESEAAAIRLGEISMVAGFSAAGVFGLTALYFWLERPARNVVARVGCGLGVTALVCSGQF